MRVLLLGGTGEARELAEWLLPSGAEVISSLAGRVTDPRLPAGRVRIGGFGGAEGLADWLRAERIDVVVDATHPFAERITAHAVTAAAACGLPLLLVRRPAWAPQAGDVWRQVPSLDHAASLVGDRRVFLTIGRQGLSRFANVAAWFLIRCVDPPAPPLPSRSEIVLSRGPFTVAGETELMRDHRIDVLVTKNSGGPAASAKLQAARELGIPVLMIDRPPAPTGLPVVSTVDAALEWLDR
jgi:precorrin-6A/cobalt-precorrin-6A reductase